MEPAVHNSIPFLQHNQSGLLSALTVPVYHSYQLQLECHLFLPSCRSSDPPAYLISLHPYHTHFDPEDGTCTCLQNTAIHLHYMVSLHWRLRFKCSEHYYDRRSISSEYVMRRVALPNQSTNYGILAITTPNTNIVSCLISSQYIQHWGLQNELQFEVELITSYSHQTGQCF
jgi:hypothetical protein